MDAPTVRHVTLTSLLQLKTTPAHMRNGIYQYYPKVHLGQQFKPAFNHLDILLSTKIVHHQLL